MFKNKDGALETLSIHILSWKLGEKSTHVGPLHADNHNQWTFPAFQLRIQNDKVQTPSMYYYHLPKELNQGHRKKYCSA